MSDPKLPFGSRMCRCPTCGAYFSGEEGFNKHRVGEIGSPSRRCLTTQEMSSAGWTTTGRGPYWQYQPKPKSSPSPPPPGSEG